MIKSKHLVFSETVEEKELRVDNEHAMLMKGKLTAHQFEPLFEASITDLEAIGLGKLPRELYLSYLRKVGPTLQKEIRKDRRLWDPADGTLRAPRTWEEAHKVVLKYEAREATNKAAASSVLTLTDPGVGGGGGGGGNGTGKGPKNGGGGNPKPDKAFTDQIAALRREVAALQSTGKDGGGRKKGVCFNMRDHGSCKEGKNCKWSHDQAEVQAARKAAKADQVNLGTGAAAKAKAKAKAKSKGKGKGGDKGDRPKSEKVCPFFAKGHCKKGASCDMVHATGTGNLTLTGGGDAPPGPVGLQGSIKNPFLTLNDGVALRIVNPFADTGVFEVVCTDRVGLSRPGSSGNKGSSARKAVQTPIKSLGELPANWWVETANERGGYQYKTVCKVFGREVEMLLDGCAGSNNVTEEFVTGLINCALKAGLQANDTGFPVVQLERWPLEEVVNGIAKSAPVPLVGGVVFKVINSPGREGCQERKGWS